MGLRRPLVSACMIMLLILPKILTYHSFKFVSNIPTIKIELEKAKEMEPLKTE